MTIDSRIVHSKNESIVLKELVRRKSDKNEGKEKHVSITIIVASVDQLNFLTILFSCSSMSNDREREREREKKINYSIDNFNGNSWNSFFYR